MPVSSEKDWVHVRIRKVLADQLRTIAEREHRYGIQTDTNLAVEMYVKKSLGVVVYGVFKADRCIYVGATSNFCDRVKSHWKKFGIDCRIEVFSASRSFKEMKLVEMTYINKFKALGQADFNTAEYGMLNPGLERVLLKDSDLRKIKGYTGKDNGK